MFDSGAIDVVLGLSFVYFVLSLLASGARETIARALSTRARFLEKGIKNLLREQEDTDALITKIMKATKGAKNLEGRKNPQRRSRAS